MIKWFQETRFPTAPLLAFAITILVVPPFLAYGRLQDDQFNASVDDMFTKIMIGGVIPEFCLKIKGMPETYTVGEVSSDDGKMIVGLKANDGIQVLQSIDNIEPTKCVTDWGLPPPPQVPSIASPEK